MYIPFIGKDFTWYGWM